jgi:hypothetical protein
MGLFECRGCKAKDSEILHLMGQLDKLNAMVEKAQQRITELAEPGITLRLAGAARVERAPIVARPASRPFVPTFPGYPPERSNAPQVELDEGPGR